MLRYLHDRFNWGFTAMFPIIGITAIVWLAAFPPVVEMALLAIQLVMLATQIAVVVQQMRGKL